MEKIEIDAMVSSFADSILETMKGIVCSGTDVEPQIFLLGEESGDSAVIPLVGVSRFFESKESKRAIRPLIKGVWQQFSGAHKRVKLIAVLVFSDAWVEALPVEDGLKILRGGRRQEFQPKPGMGEALLVQVSLADSDIGYQWPYVRGEGKKVVFASERIEMKSEKDAPRALLMGLWPL